MVSVGNEGSSDSDATSTKRKLKNIEVSPKVIANTLLQKNILHAASLSAKKDFLSKMLEKSDRIKDLVNVKNIETPKSSPNSQPLKGILKKSLNKKSDDEFSYDSEANDNRDVFTPKFASTQIEETTPKIQKNKKYSDYETNKNIKELFINKMKMVVNKSDNISEEIINRLEHQKGGTSNNKNTDSVFENAKLVNKYNNDKSVLNTSKVMLGSINKRSSNSDSDSDSEEDNNYKRDFPDIGSLDRFRKIRGRKRELATIKYSSKSDSDIGSENNSSKNIIHAKKQNYQSRDNVRGADTSDEEEIKNRSRTSKEKKEQSLNSKSNDKILSKNILKKYIETVHQKKNKITAKQNDSSLDMQSHRDDIKNANNETSEAKKLLSKMFTKKNIKSPKKYYSTSDSDESEQVGKTKIQNKIDRNNLSISSNKEQHKHLKQILKNSTSESSSSDSDTNKKRVSESNYILKSLKSKKKCGKLNFSNNKSSSSESEEDESSKRKSVPKKAKSKKLDSKKAKRASSSSESEEDESDKTKSIPKKAKSKEADAKKSKKASLSSETEEDKPDKRKYVPKKAKSKELDGKKVKETSSSPESDEDTSNKRKPAPKKAKSKKLDSKKAKRASSSSESDEDTSNKRKAAPKKAKSKKLDSKKAKRASSSSESEEDESDKTKCIPKKVKSKEADAKKSKKASETEEDESGERKSVPRKAKLEEPYAKKARKESSSFESEKSEREINRNKEKQSSFSKTNLRKHKSSSSSDDSSSIVKNRKKSKNDASNSERNNSSDSDDNSNGNLYLQKLFTEKKHKSERRHSESISKSTLHDYKNSSKRKLISREYDLSDASNKEEKKNKSSDYNTKNNQGVKRKNKNLVESATKNKRAKISESSSDSEAYNELSHRKSKARTPAEKLLFEFETERKDLKEINTTDLDYNFPSKYSDEELFIAKIPKDLHSYLSGAKLSLTATTKINTNEGKLICVPSEVTEGKNELNFFTQENGKLNIISTTLCGKLTGYQELETLPEMKVAENKNRVALPSNLKQRHPLFGPNYVDKTELNEDIKSKLEASALPVKIKSKKHKKEKQKDLEVKEQSYEHNELIFQMLGKTQEQINNTPHKHKKKSKKETTANMDIFEYLNRHVFNSELNKEKSQENTFETIIDNHVVFGNIEEEKRKKKRKRENEDFFELDSSNIIKDHKRMKITMSSEEEPIDGRTSFKVKKNRKS